MDKVLVCLTGVVNRSIKYTWPSIEDNLVKPLKTMYAVDIAVFNNNVEDCRVDGICLDNSDMSIIPYDFLFEHKQTTIDEYIREVDGYEKEIPPYFCGNIKKNGLRLMYLESRVAKFLEGNKETYEWLIVSNADYFYTNKLPLKCLKSIGKKMIGTCHHLDATGYTDGFYIGRAEDMIKVLSRINYYADLIKDPTDGWNYESQLRRAFVRNSIERLKIDISFIKVRSSLKIAGAHMGLWVRPIKEFKRFLSDNEDKNETYAFLLRNALT